MVNSSTAGKSFAHAKYPGHMVDFIASPKRVRVTVNGETIEDSTRMMLMREMGKLPAYYFPLDNV